MNPTKGWAPLPGRCLFNEKQPFRELAFLLLPVLVQTLLLWGLIQQAVFNKPWGTRPGSDLMLILVNALMFLILLLLFSIRLDTRISEKGISVRMRPFQWRWRNFPLESIASMRLVRYDGIRDYWGYGLRYSRKKGWCYTISGTDGLEIILNDQKRFLIGTHLKNELSAILESWAAAWEPR